MGTDVYMTGGKIRPCQRMRRPRTSYPIPRPASVPPRTSSLILRPRPTSPAPRAAHRRRRHFSSLPLTSRRPPGIRHFRPGGGGACRALWVLTGARRHGDSGTNGRGHLTRPGKGPLEARGAGVARASVLVALVKVLFLYTTTPTSLCKLSLGDRFRWFWVGYKRA